MAAKKTKPATGAARSDRRVSILVANGVNLDLLGSRETGLYGTATLRDLQDLLDSCGQSLAKDAGFAGVALEYFQTNREYELLEKLSANYDGVLINAGAWTHTSLALADRFRGLALPYVEVHLSNISAREDFRKHSYLAPSAAGIVYGMGLDSYVAGLCGLLRRLKSLNQSS